MSRNRFNGVANCPSIRFLADRQTLRRLVSSRAELDQHPRDIEAMINIVRVVKERGRDSNRTIARSYLHVGGRKCGGQSRRWLVGIKCDNGTAILRRCEHAMPLIDKPIVQTMRERHRVFLDPRDSNSFQK